MLALLRDPKSPACKVLCALGATLDETRTQVLEYLGPESGPEPEHRRGGLFSRKAEFDVSSAVRLVIEEAELLAGGKSAEVSHLLLALLNEPKSLLPRLLQLRGVAPDTARREIKTENPPPENPPPASETEGNESGV